VYIYRHPSGVGSALPTLKVRHSAMIDLPDRVVSFEQPFLRIGPPLTRSEFLTADWAQGADDSGVRRPSTPGDCAGRTGSMSLPFVVILRFEGERSTMLNLSLPCYGTSWADYSEGTERQRQQSLNVVVEKPRR
jgi:hypothetical protein